RPGKTDRIGLDRLPAGPGHERDHSARVDPTRQEGTERHVAHHLHLDSLGDPRPDFIDPIALSQGMIDLPWRRPISPDLEPVSFHHQQRGWWDLTDTAKDGVGRRHVADLQVSLQCSLVNLGDDAW